MPAYLIAVVVSELECRENEAKNFSICYRPSAFDRIDKSFEMGQRLLQAYDELFDYKYSTDMKKLTIAALPQIDPGIGGMENWGKKLNHEIHYHSQFIQCPLRSDYVPGVQTYHRSEILDGKETSRSSRTKCS